MDLARLARRHWLFGLVLAAALALRILTALAFRPIMWFGGDSASYLATGLRLIPDLSRVGGYGFMLWVLRPVLRWRTTTYELTTRRLRVRSGIVTRRGRDIPLARINDVSFEKGLLDRLFGSGRLVVESAGEHGQILLNDIPRVEYTQATLFRLVEEEQRRLERSDRDQP